MLQRNRFKTLLLAVFCVACMTFAITASAAPDTGPATKAPPTMVQPASAASQPATATDEPVEPPDVPTDVSGALDLGKQVVEHGKAKQWFAMSAGIIWLLMFAFKFARKKIDAMKKIPKRVLWIIVPVLSVVAMVLAKFQADLSWGNAVAVLTSGPAVAFLNDMVKRGILGKEPSSPVNGGADEGDAGKLKRDGIG